VLVEMGLAGGPLYQSFVLWRNGSSCGPICVGEKMEQLDGPLNICFLGKNDEPPGGPTRK